MRTAPFLLRRVLLGVLAGAAIVLIAFYGWVRYRTSQYHERENRMLRAHYQAYVLCLRTGTPSTTCAVRVYESCVRDPFWLVAKPFALDLRYVQAEAPKRCRNGATG